MDKMERIRNNRDEVIEKLLQEQDTMKTVGSGLAFMDTEKARQFRILSQARVNSGLDKWEGIWLQLLLLANSLLSL